MAVNLSPIGNDAPFLDANGNPLSGGKLYTYTAGSSTAQTTYTTSAGSVANANPIILNSNGYPAASGSVVSIWLTAGVSYKFVLKTSADVEVWSRDNISGINDTTVTIDQWVAGPAPTYVSATQLTLVGDQTSTFHVGRRLKIVDSGGTKYATITASAYTSLTTLTVVVDASGSLASPLSTVSYGLLSTTNPSSPILTDSDFRISGSSDLTKKVAFEVDGLTTATTRTITVPDVNVDLQYSRAGSDTQSGALEIATQAEVNAMTDTSRTLTPNHNKIVLGTQQATTSGTSIDFTSIPSGVREIHIMFEGVSTNGTDSLLIQIGDAGGVETTGYVGNSTVLGSATTAFTAGFGVVQASAAATQYGCISLYLKNSAAFTWVARGILSRGDTNVEITTSGLKSLSAELDRVRITTTGGANTFDAGSINISYAR